MCVYVKQNPLECIATLCIGGISSLKPSVVIERERERERERDRDRDRSSTASLEGSSRASAEIEYGVMCAVCF